MSLIGAYAKLPTAFRQHDPLAAGAARVLIEAIGSGDGRIRAEHVGSSAVPGCGGKGYVDLLVTYPDGSLETAKRVLAALGFQRQQSSDPFPEERPMRVGSIEHGGRRFFIHAHVVAETSHEAAELVAFRDLLRADAALRRAYEAEKRRILETGVADGADYAVRKGAFVERALASR